MSRDALRNLSRLPRWCYGLIDGETVTIARGAPQSAAVAVARDQVDQLNAAIGVTTEQRLAMEAGIAFGWTADAADPDFHAVQLNTSLVPLRRYRVAAPLVTIIEVAARTDEAAIEAATRDLNLPGHVEIDGPLSIIEDEELT